MIVRGMSIVETHNLSFDYIRRDDEGNVAIHLNKDAETIMKLIRFDINNVIEEI